MHSQTHTSFLFIFLVTELPFSRCLIFFPLEKNLYISLSDESNVHLQLSYVHVHVCSKNAQLWFFFCVCVCVCLKISVPCMCTDVCLMLHVKAFETCYILHDPDIILRQLLRYLIFFSWSCMSRQSWMSSPLTPRTSYEMHISRVCVVMCIWQDR